MAVDSLARRVEYVSLDGDGILPLPGANSAVKGFTLLNCYNFPVIDSGGTSGTPPVTAGITDWRKVLLHVVE